MTESQQTMKFTAQKEIVDVKEVLTDVFKSLEEKGYNPINQIVGYLLSGDPAYITSHNNARVKIRKLERDDILEELVKSYIDVVVK
ncbi:IreB family regulatory phosphoprotein [Alkalicella caledoniensis]|uniref:UPF0297 protein HYG86_15555 n=1 Tax=Alkalicella caledoniensis TaxID=2731377 RepID=A0A7G9WBM0_ALKCA|nr:IreB family regulatory phosphoprotein [Alkalicella caledoniensis]QNO16082.1 IreB family regulatory phosphoprotein [Alkalicella caledoniensis]